LDFFQNQIANQIGVFDTLCITEIIASPIISISGFLWSNKGVYIEYTNKYVNEISYNMINKNDLMSKNVYYKYFLDENFIRVRHEIKYSSIICDGEIVILIKCIKEDLTYKFDIVIFDSFVLYENYSPEW